MECITRFYMQQKIKTKLSNSYKLLSSYSIVEFQLLKVLILFVLFFSRFFSRKIITRKLKKVANYPWWHNPKKLCENWYKWIHIIISQCVFSETTIQILCHLCLIDFHPFRGIDNNAWQQITKQNGKLFIFYVWESIIFAFIRWFEHKSKRYT